MTVILQIVFIGLCAPQPMFDRQPPSVTSWMLTGHSNDDSIAIVSPQEFHLCILMTVQRVQNTQSGSQWDGLKHYGVAHQNVFYNKSVLIAHVLC